MENKVKLVQMLLSIVVNLSKWVEDLKLLCWFEDSDSIQICLLKSYDLTSLTSLSSESQATTVGSEEDLGEPAREDDQIHPWHSQWPSVTQNIIFYFPLLFIRPRSHHSVPLSLLNSLADSLTHSCCWELTDTTLAFEDANAKLLDVVDIADVDAEQLFGDSLVDISKVKFGRDIEPEFI